MPGWEDLIKCNYVSSFDGSETLSLLPNGLATLYDDSGKHRSLDGTWRFDPAVHRYAITMNGKTGVYALVAPQGPVCILVTGNSRSADLEHSWFWPTEEPPAPENP
jgi:hypothetical protein